MSQHRVENGENKLLGFRKKRSQDGVKVTDFRDLQPRDDEDLQSSVQERHDERKKVSRSIMMTQNNSSQASLSSTQVEYKIYTDFDTALGNRFCSRSRIIFSKNDCFCCYKYIACYSVNKSSLFEVKPSTQSDYTS